MQTLWSRVAQAQSTCRCRPCLHPVNALTRRSTTAASRRRVTAADLFTACYTTILGTAVVIDSQRKGVRRKELDEKLERARASLSSLAVQEAPASPEEYETPKDLSQGNKNTQTQKTTLTEAGDISELLDELAHISSGPYAPSRHSNWLRHEIDWVQVEAAITAEEKDSSVLLRHPKDQSQLERQTRTVGSLVQTLLWRARNPACGSESNISTSGGSRSLEEAEELMENYPNYLSPHIELEAANDARIYLNETFRNIFDKTTDVQEAVGKICYNLLVSASPPNIHNYNALIAGFNRIRRPDLAQVVVESYLDKTTFPATSQTLVCLLNHASGTQDMNLFREIVGRMSGRREDGMKLCSIPRHSAWFKEADKEWARASFTLRKHSYIKKTPRNQQVFDSLIRGWLKLGNTQAACMSFVACVRNELLVPTHTIYEVLTACLLSMDHRRANTMLSKLTKDLGKFAKLLDHIAIESTAEMGRKIAELFTILLDLCEFTYKPFSGTKKRLGLMLESFQTFFNADSSKNSPHLKALLRVAGLANKIQYSEKWTLRLEAHIKALTIQIRTGYDVGAETRLPSLHSSLPYNRHSRPSPALFRALLAIDMSADLSSMNRLKAHISKRLPDERLGRKLRRVGGPGFLHLESLISFYHPNQTSKRGHAVGTGSVFDRLEGDAAEIEDNIRAILFCHSTISTQRDCRNRWPDWQDMPVEQLFRWWDESLRQQIDDRRALPDQYSKVRAENVIGQINSPQERLIWADDISSLRRYVDIPLPETKSATEVSAMPVQLWSDEHVKYQHAQAASG